MSFVAPPLDLTFYPIFNPEPCDRCHVRASARCPAGADRKDLNDAVITYEGAINGIVLLQNGTCCIRYPTLHPGNSWPMA